MNTSAYEIQTAQSDEQILQCFPLLKLLRPQLEEESFLEQIHRQMEQGYRLIFIADNEEVQSVVGYRFSDFLAWGKVLYVDDLITSPDARGIGFGTHLIKWLMGEAKNQGCEGIQLDTKIDHGDAHRLYLNLGFKIDCLHLSMQFSVMKGILLFLIRLYQMTLSPFFGKDCRFFPSCSQYCLEAIEKHGAIKGSWLGLKRLAKCGPWHKGGVDQVP